MKMKRFFGLGIVMILVISLSAFVIAEERERGREERAERLDLSLENLECRNNLVLEVVNDSDSYGIGSSLKQYYDKLVVDIGELRGYVDNNDSEGYRNYLKSTYDVDYKVAKDAVNAWRKDSMKNMTLVQRTEMRDDYNLMKRNHDECNLDNLRKYGRGRLTAFNSILEAHQKKADDLASKGVNTDLLNKIISDARVQIISPMENVVGNSSGANQIQQALKGYCLYDGCKTGVNFHFSAKWEIAKLDMAMARIQNSSNVSAFGDKVSQLETEISQSKSALSNVGSGKYTVESKKHVWNNIRAAQVLVKEISKMMRGKNE